MGLDVGTSGVKAVIVAGDGTVLARVSRTYPTDADAHGHEQDAELYLSTVHDVVAACDVSGLSGIGVVGQTPSLVVVDDQARPRRRAMTWRDTRADAEAAELERSHGSSVDAFGVDNLWDVSQLPAKLLWLARHDPEALAGARWLLQPKDFVGFALTGVPGSDLWSSKGLCSVATGRAAEAVFEHAGVSSALLPPMRDPWTLLGHTDGATTAALGFDPGTPVAVGWTDALAGMLGIGAITSPISFVLTGTSDIVGVSSAEPRPRTRGLYQVPSTCCPLTIDYGPTQSSGASLTWLSRATGRTVADLVDLAETAHETGLTFLPYLRGERAPLWNPEVRSSITGICDDDGLPELALAVMRGVSLSDRHVLETCWADRLPAEVHLGGANLDRGGWTRARQDVLEQDLLVHQEPQLPALGAAVLAKTAATGSSLEESYECLQGAIDRLPATPDRHQPERFARYREDVAYAASSTGV